MRALRRKLLHALDNHGGFLGLVRHVFKRRAVQQNTAEERPVQAHPFDVAHGTDTGGYIPGQHLGSGASADLYNTAYWAISPSTLEAALERFGEPAEAYTFVDLGCGKGRALLVAGRLPFRAIVGVELSPDLCAIARQNAVGDRRIEVLQADATTVVYPAGPLLIFLYHPFLAPVLRRTLRNLEAQAGGRPVSLLYANPTYPRVMARFAFLAELWTQSLPLSAEDAAHDRHGIREERFTLYRGKM